MVLTDSDTKRQNISEGEAFLVDRISNLPDSLLSFILSFLPTKQVVATDILSKRWRYVWTSVDKLDFDNRYCSISFKVQKHFAPFVYKVLKLHQGNIKDLKLSCFNRGCNVSDITNWTNIAIACGVERLDLMTYFEYEWPLAIFICKTLVDLKIDRIDIRDMNIPSAPFFQCLKKLHVQSLKYDTESLKHFISRCPILEQFVSVSRGSVEVIPVDIVSSTLKRLELSSNHVGFEEKLHLGVPALEYIRFRFILPPEISLEDQLPCLVEADISFFDIYPENVNIKLLRDSFVRFIQPFANVKVLRLNCHVIKFLTSVGHARFHNLMKLEITSFYFEWRLLICLMDSSINLESITMKKTSKYKKHKLAWKDPKNVPTCLSSSLRKITLDGYSGDELSMVKYVLATAESLEQMDIRCSIRYRDNNEWKSDMLQKLQKLPRASERCEISLVASNQW